MVTCIFEKIFVPPFGGGLGTVANGLLQRTVAVMNHLLGGGVGVLGQSLGALGHGVLGQLTGEEAYIAY